MNRFSILSSPDRKRNQQRPSKKGHTGTNKDIEGVGEIGEVTPDKSSTSDGPSIMRTSTATRHERSLSSEPNANLEHESSDAEDAQSKSFLLMLMGEKIDCVIHRDVYPKIS